MTAAVLYLVLSLALLVVTTQLTFHRASGSTMGAVLGGPVLLLANFTPQWLAVGAVLSVVAWCFDAFSHPAGLVGLALHLACWLALALHLGRVHSTLPLLDGAVLEDQHQPLGMTGEPLVTRGAWLRLVGLRSLHQDRVTVTRNLIYREVDGVRLRLDVYQPRARGPHPAIIYMHGGGWVFGHRHINHFMLTRIAAAGWTVFAVAYRRPPRFPLPAAVFDCKAAIGWIRQHAGEYDADPSTLVAYGESAGGHLAALLAVTGGTPELQPGFENVDTRVQGAMVFYGVTDLVGSFERRDHPGLTLLLEHAVVRKCLGDGRDLYQSVDPTSCHATSSPPTLLVHGSADMMVPAAMSRRFQQRLKALGASAHLLEVPWASHAFDLYPSPLQERVLRVVLAFLTQIRAASGAERSR